jgi:hypothetical protein
MGSRAEYYHTRPSRRQRKLADNGARPAAIVENFGTLGLRRMASSKIVERSK